ncbi:hypothetical protein EA658_20380 [Pseudoxanthomonas winnipegensis]|uniref:Uncharacterized protein n=1 Tax=Pseudoxanthomonas winnipegensis TaxID=2480810 RepID=A0ABY1W8Y1_9GAMM|nr:hypothetical protein [Pseudoxanthomonas winnipegensis]TAA08222.1 hypothetical protein EA659_16200 [Pseudoxanthomonas winnipegensis]TAA16244.1 hypothetical protein EA658_20380 [Pseudoxanthomonas winnipegensis]TAH72683.1 hypothetical protein EA657_10625 [Pseudoxanthomonas winnipegensis]
MELEPAEPIWIKTAERAQLRYRHAPLADYVLHPDYVAVTTRSYSTGFRPTLRFASEEVARRYIFAWMKKWGERAMADIDAQAMEGLRAQAARLAERPPLDFTVPKRPLRRPRRG